MDTLIAPAPAPATQPTQNGNGVLRGLPIFRNEFIFKSPYVARKVNIIVAGKEISVLKAKVPNHDKGTYVLRRMDTDYVNASQLYKAAFPTAPDQLEQQEMAYLRSDSRTVVLEGGRGKHLVTGTWVPLATAKLLARDYGLEKALSLLLNVKNPLFPDNNMDDVEIATETMVTETDSIASLEVGSITTADNEEAKTQVEMIVTKTNDGEVSIEDEKEVVVTENEMESAALLETSNRKRKVDTVEVEDAVIEAENSSSSDAQQADAKKAKSEPEAERQSKRLRWLGLAAMGLAAAVAGSMYALESLPFL